MANLIGIWILWQGMCVAAGWTLSLMGQVNAMGYLVFFALMGAAFALWGKRWWTDVLRMKRPGWRRCARRFRRVFPMLFLLGAVGALLGGAFYSPNNYDALTYRLPRVLSWWGHSGWYWIATPDPRVNFSAAGFEWLMMPMLVLTHSDRFIFLINFAGYLLMPGLLFSVLVEAGVAARVAWAWMWLLPMGYCYLMEAGSIGNDMIAASYVLAALYFAFRARKSSRVEDLGLAFVAAGLATGVKASNLPLLLPIFFALWPALGLLRSRLVFGAVVILLSMVVSFCPLVLLNQAYTGQWAGDPGNLQKQQVKSPIAGVIGNSLLLTAQAISPPLFPYARNVSEWVGDRIPKQVHTWLVRDFPRFGWQLGELPQEESGGLGLGITVLLVAAFFSRRNSRAAGRRPLPQRPGLLIGIMAWVALLAYMAKLGNEAASRLLSPYYPLLVLPILLIPAQERLVRRRWWRILGLLSGLGALLALVLTPSRPLWPAGRICAWLANECPHNLQFRRAQTVYAVYSNRYNLLVPLSRQIPDAVPTIGVIDGEDDADASLWRPYGLRQVRYLTATDLRRPPDLEWLVIKQHAFEFQTGESLDAWVRRIGGSVVAREMIAAKASHEPDAWYVVRVSAKG